MFPADGIMVDTNRLVVNGGIVGIGTTTPGTKLEVAGGIKPGNVTTGASCAGNSEGSFGYDSTAHAPVYCGNTGLWTAIGGVVSIPSGTHCGWSATNCSGTYASSCIVTCQGYNPSVSCPSGYTQKVICDDNGNNCGQGNFVCVKN